MKAQDFLEKINQKYGRLEKFGWVYEYQNDFLKENDVEIVERIVTDISDSYDFTDEILEVIFRHIPTGNYFKMEGSNASYQGEDWDSLTDVEVKIKEVKVYE